ncbi:AraC family transcriptional regulator [Nocardia alni]|uniref:AraC family transcriptional regulator n=1 Tax=Nocardia alni TaxID=2815723 RepID=UPI001C2157C0|nr:AraC family transcriptional regulator [Nocardia alni]
MAVASEDTVPQRFGRGDSGGESTAMEIGPADTIGILRQPWIAPARTSAGLGWDGVYLSTQTERPYRADFSAATTHLVILHLDGPVRVRRGAGKLTRARTVPPGGLFLHPAGADLTVELGGDLHTVHAYLDDRVVREAAADAGGPVRLAQEFGSCDPLVEQLILALDRLVRGWEPSARTYADHLQSTLAAHLVRAHRQGSEPVVTARLSQRQLDRVRALMAERLAESIPLADLAATTALSVSQFSRRFRATTGEPPHRYLIRMRLDQARRMLRTTTMPIAEIATGCGFSHQEHLTRVMHARLGTTPAALRRQS